MPVIATDELAITSMNFPPYSTRTATQTLVPIEASKQLARTVNGQLADVSDPDALFRQFATSIVCTHFQVPEFAFPGEEVTVDCIVELGFKTSGGTQIRNEVPGSMRTDGDYTFYRPRLTMRVVSFSILRDDWNAMVSWQLDLEESQVEVVTT